MAVRRRFPSEPRPPGLGGEVSTSMVECRENLGFSGPELRVRLYRAAPGNQKLARNS